MSRSAFLEERITLRRSTILSLMCAAAVTIGAVGAIQWGAPWPIAFCALPAFWNAWRDYRKDYPVR